jgi:hypothetical protein
MNGARSGRYASGPRRGTSLGTADQDSFVNEKLG